MVFCFSFAATSIFLWTASKFYCTPSPFSETSANSMTEVCIQKGFLLFRIQLGLSPFFFFVQNVQRYYSWNSNFQPHQENAFSKVTLRHLIILQSFLTSNRNISILGGVHGYQAGYCAQPYKRHFQAVIFKSESLEEFQFNTDTSQLYFQN